MLPRSSVRARNLDVMGPPILPGEVIGTILQDKEHALSKVQQRIRRMMLTPLQVLTEIGRILFRQMKNELTFARPHPVLLKDSLLDRYVDGVMRIRTKKYRSAAALVAGISCLDFGADGTMALDRAKFEAVSGYAARRLKIKPASVLSHARFWVSLLREQDA